MNSQLESTIVQVTALTAENDHTQARLEIAAFFMNTKLVNAYAGIENLNSFYKYMPINLGEIRSDLDNSLKSLIWSNLSEPDALRLWSTL